MKQVKWRIWSTAKPNKNRGRWAERQRIQSSMQQSMHNFNGPFGGKRVRIQNLQQRPDLNGQVGTAVGWRLDLGRYEVKMDSGELTALRPESLELADVVLALDEVSLALHQVELLYIQRSHPSVPLCLHIEPPQHTAT